MRIYRRAARQAIAEAHAAGLPVFQGRDGYLVAIDPDGRVARLKKLATPPTNGKATHAEAKPDNSRRTKRRRKVHARARSVS
ncbi:MAG: hypothetical protein HY246_07475 [Proteobacteria bacterium]|nr:hypothetical protein [Pseudomonadota bacterium]